LQIAKVNIEKPVELLTCGHFVSDVAWTHGRRCLDSFEIIIGVDQILYISQNGVEYEIHPGDAFLLLPGLIHEGYRPCEEGVSFFWFHFLTGESYDVLSEGDFGRELVELNKPDSPLRCTSVYLPFQFTPPAIERVNIMFQQLQHVSRSNYYTKQAAHYTATSLLIELSEQMISDYQTSSVTSSGDRSVTEIIEWIRLHALQDISVADIAERFMYNKEYLSRFFKKKTGYNLLEYINLMKISKAKELLSTSTHSIRYIADCVGIEDEKYFMRLFRKYERMTPTEYRKAFFRLHMNNH